MGTADTAISGRAPNSYWSDTYRGHWIAAVREERAWLVVLDNVVQKERDFDTSEEAAAWLRRAIDAQIAERIFPGLADERMTARR